MFSFHYSPLLWPYLLSAAVCLGIAWHTWRRPANLLHRSFALMMLAAGWWALSGMLEVASANERTMLFWMKLKYLGIVPVGPLWLIMTIAYVQRPHWLRLWYVRAAIGLELSMIVFALSNDYTRWWWSHWHYVSSPWMNGMDVVWGPAFWLHVLLAYSMLFAVIVILLRYFDNVARYHRKQIVFLLLALSLPLGSNALLLSGRTPAPWASIDFTPIPMAISGGIIGYALFRYGLLSVTPIARDILFNQVNDGVIVIDARNVIIDINRAALRYLHLANKEVVGQSISDLDLPANVLACLAPDTATDLPYECDLVLQEDDRPMYLHVIVTALGDTPQLVVGRRMVTLRDETEHWLYQETVTRYVRMVAHDVRSPLSLAVGYLSLVEKAQLDDTTRSYLDIVEDALRRIDHLTAELLDLERLRQGVGMHHITFDPLAVVEEVYNDVLPLATAKSQRFELSRPQSLPRLYGDPFLIRQALVNVVTNAIKYTPPRGLIQLQAGLVEGHVVFSVQDNGLGIAAEHLPHLFEPFQHDHIRSDGQVGSGLGLSLVKAIVEAHEGEVLVESEPGKGSCFSIHIPIPPPQLRK